MITARIPLPHGGGKQWPNRVVVHAMAEYIEYQGRHLHAVDLLDELRLSAHALVTPSAVVIRCRNDDETAWHAKGHNSNTLGIEILVPGVHGYGSFLEAIEKPYYSREQLLATVEQVRTWMNKYPIHEVVRHSDIDPERKQDPGSGFRWNEFKAMLK